MIASPTAALACGTSHQNVEGYDYTNPHYGGYSLGYNGDYTFKVQNIGHVSIWRFYIDGQGSPFNYSPTMNFQQGTVSTNSERYNTCDSMFTHMYGLQYFSSSGSWRPYSSLREYACDATNGWEINILSNTELYVDQNGGSC